MILRDRTWKTEDHPWFSMVTQVQPNYRLEKRGNKMATPEDRLESIGRKRKTNLKSTTTQG